MGVRVFAAAACIFCLTVALLSARTAASPGSPERVTGLERVAWDFALPAGGGNSSYDFGAYIDGVRTALEGVVCEKREQDMTCTARLPRLSAGRHVLELFGLVDGAESARSDPLVVDVVPLNSPSRPSEASARSTSTAAPDPDDLTSPVRDSGGRIDADEPPSDATVLPDGRMVVIERSGVVTMLDREQKSRTTALVLRDVETATGMGLFAVAAHPRFEHNRYVYLAYAARTRAGPVEYRVIRTREAGNTLGEVAVLLDGVPATAPAWASLRFGPDSKLYVALGAAADDTRDAHPYNGSIVRLEDDGTTPRDSRAWSPIYARGIGTPRGLTWTADGELWVAATDSTGCGRAFHLGRHMYELGCEVTPRGMAYVRDVTQSREEIWIGRSDRAGVWVIAPRDAAAVPANGSIASRESGTSRIGCVVARPAGGAYLCASDGMRAMTLP